MKGTQKKDPRPLNKKIVVEVLCYKKLEVLREEHIQIASAHFHLLITGCDTQTVGGH